MNQLAGIGASDFKIKVPKHNIEVCEDKIGVWETNIGLREALRNKDLQKTRRIQYAYLYYHFDHVV